MFHVGVIAYMRAAVLAVVLILAACSSSSGPKPQSSVRPNATPTAIAVTPTPTPTSQLTWAAPVRVDHHPPFAGNYITGVSCPSVNFCVAVDDSGNVVTSTNPTGGAAAWTVTNVGGYDLTGVSCPSSVLCVAGGQQATTWSPPVTPRGGGGLDGDPHRRGSGQACPVPAAAFASPWTRTATWSRPPTRPGVRRRGR